MDRMIHTAVTALRGTMARQAATANNLANAATTGFRADLSLADAHYVHGAGADSRVLARENMRGADMSAAPSVTTGRDLDIALQGSALLAVQAADGEEAYTRRGDLSVAPSGFLQTGDGLLVLGEDGPIAVPPADSIRIAEDGQVWIVPPGGDPGAPQSAGRLKLVSAAGADIIKGIDNQLKLRGGGTLPADADARVTPGALEGSNVNSTAALVAMIDSARAYEMQVRLVSTAEAIDQSGTRLMSLPA